MTTKTARRMSTHSKNQERKKVSKVNWSNNLDLIAVVNHLKKAYGITNVNALKISQICASRRNLTVTTGAIERAISRHKGNRKITSFEEAFSDYESLQALLGDKIHQEAIMRGLIRTKVVSFDVELEKEVSKEPETLIEDGQKQDTFSVVEDGMIELKAFPANEIQILIPVELLNKKISLTIERE